LVWELLKIRSRVGFFGSVFLTTQKNEQAQSRSEGFNQKPSKPKPIPPKPNSPKLTKKKKNKREKQETTHHKNQNKKQPNPLNQKKPLQK
jgi:hypothetical protein